MPFYSILVDRSQAIDFFYSDGILNQYQRDSIMNTWCKEQGIGYSGVEVKLLSNLHDVTDKELQSAHTAVAPQSLS